MSVASRAVFASLALVGVTVIVPAVLSTAIVAQSRVVGETDQPFTPSVLVVTVKIAASVSSLAQVFEVGVTESFGAVRSSAMEVA